MFKMLLRYFEMFPMFKTQTGTILPTGDDWRWYFIPNVLGKNTEEWHPYPGKIVSPLEPLGGGSNF